MDKIEPSVAQQIARAASAFEQRRTGRAPESVAVVLSENTLVITLHGALSPAEKALAKSPQGAAEVQELHKRLFHTSADELRQEITKITGVKVREAAAEVEPSTGTVVQVFSSGSVVQVYLLAGASATTSWRGDARTPPRGSRRAVPGGRPDGGKDTEKRRRTVSLRRRLPGAEGGSCGNISHDM